MDQEEVVETVVPRVVARAAFQSMVQHAQQRRRQYYHEQPDFWDFVYEPVQSDFSGVIPTILHILKVTSQFVLFVTISSVSYLVFYHIMMPTHFATETLYFDYTQKYNPAIHTRIAKRIRKDVQCNIPWAAVDLFAKKTTWEAQYIDVLPNPRVTTNRLLAAGQPYFIETILKLPESDVNLQAGMFGVVSELRSTNGTLLAVSRRSTRIPQESLWIKTIYKGICIVPLLLGAMDESRTILIPSYRHFTESYDMPLQHVVVRIEAQGSVIPEVVGGGIRIGKELNAFQEILKKWFYTCFIIGSVMFGFVYMIQWQILRAVWTTIYQRYNTQDDFDIDLDSDFTDSELWAEQEDVKSEHSVNERWYDVDSGGTSRSRSSSWIDPPTHTQTTVQGETSRSRSSSWEDLPVQRTRTTALHNGGTPQSRSSSWEDLPAQTQTTGPNDTSFATPAQR